MRSLRHQVFRRRNRRRKVAIRWKETQQQQQQQQQHQQQQQQQQHEKEISEHRVRNSKLESSPSFRRTSLRSIQKSRPFGLEKKLP